MASGKLGSADLSASTNTLLYTVTTGKTATISISIVNRNSSNINFNVAIGNGGSPSTTDYIEYGTSLAGNGVFERTGVVCSSGENVWVNSDTSNVSVRVYGFEG
jgi:hypothetical protein